MANNKNQLEQAGQNKIQTYSFMEKALGKVENLDRDDVLDLIFWFRILVGVVIGTAAGVVGLTGFPVIVAIGIIVIFGTIGY